MICFILNKLLKLLSRLGCYQEDGGRLSSTIQNDDSLLYNIEDDDIEIDDLTPGIPYEMPDHAPFDGPTDEIVFVLVNYILEYIGRSVDYCFLSINNNDPTKEFMDKFAFEKPQVAPASLVKHEMIGLSHKKFGGNGCSVDISDIKWISATKVSASWEYYRDPLCASGNTAILDLKNGKWIVTENIEFWRA